VPTDRDSAAGSIKVRKPIRGRRCDAAEATALGPEPEILRPNCHLMNHRIRLDDIVVSVEHREGKLGGLPK
jgi:hypothetical protein